MISSSSGEYLSGSKFFLVATAGSFTKPSFIAFASEYSYTTFLNLTVLAPFSICGVAVSSRPSTGFNSLITLIPASAL